MTQKYEDWFLVHSGIKKESFLNVMKGTLNLVKTEKPAERPKEKPKEKKEKGETNYERWFYRNCDNNNIPDLTEIKSHDYAAWFDRHCIRRKKCKKTCDKSYSAWFERNKNDLNPGVYTPPPLTYEQWFKKHRTPSEPIKTSCVKHEPYDEWFKRHKVVVK